MAEFTGPDGGGDRFHAYFSDKSPVAHVFLDLDDVSSFGPETMTVLPAENGGNYVAGDYHVWIHNYSNEPEFDVSAATVTLFAGGSQIAQYSVRSVSCDATLDIWQVVEFSVSADGAVSGIQVLQSFADGSPPSEF